MIRILLALIGLGALLFLGLFAYVCIAEKSVPQLSSAGQREKVAPSARVSQSMEEKGHFAPPGRSSARRFW